MLTLLAFFAVSLVLSIVLTPVARALARRLGLTDKPDQRRKLHASAIPVAGGIAVLVASSATIALMLLTDNCPWSDEFNHQKIHWIGLAAAAMIVCIVGVVDDFGRLRGRHKLLGQVFAIGVLIGSGLIIQTIRVGDFEIDLGILAIPFTAFFLLGAINSLNLMDGMDGLLGTLALIVTLAFAGMAALGDKWATACIAVTMAGALLGFLRYNFPPASIYLGDAGSMLVGLVIGSLAIKSSLKGAATVTLAAPVAILIVPILDTLAAIFRRKLTGRSIYTSDRGHLHHCLLRQGFSKIAVLLLVSLFSLLAVGGAFLSIALSSEILALLAVVTVATILIGMGWFGYGECLLVRDRLKGLAISFLKLPGGAKPQDSAVRLQGSGAWADQWANLVGAAAELKLKTVRLDINAPALHESYHARWVNPHDDDAEKGDGFWSAALPLFWQAQTVGRLEVSGTRDDKPVWMKIAHLAKNVEDVEQVLCKLADDAGIADAVTIKPIQHSTVPALDLSVMK